MDIVELNKNTSVTIVHQLNSDPFTVTRIVTQLSYIQYTFYKLSIPQGITYVHTYTVLYIVVHNETEPKITYFCMFTCNFWLLNF